MTGQKLEKEVTSIHTVSISVKRCSSCYYSCFFILTPKLEDDKWQHQNKMIKKLCGIPTHSHSHLVKKDVWSGAIVVIIDAKSPLLESAARCGRIPPASPRCPGGGTFHGDSSGGKAHFLRIVPLFTITISTTAVVGFKSNSWQQ